MPSPQFCINFLKMDFGSNFVFAPKTAQEDYELIPESTYNHVVKGYASTSADYKDDGEVI